MTRNQTASQTIVAVAMGLVVGASCVALYQHAGVPGPIAATTALAAYLVLLTGHALVWRGALPSGFQFGSTAAKDRRDQEIRRLKEEARNATAKAGFAQGHSIRPDLPPHTTVAQAQRGIAPGAPAAPQLSLPPQGGPRFAPLQPQAGAAPQPVARAPERAAPPPLPAANAPKAPPPAPVQSSSDDLDDFMGYRPAKDAAPKLPPFVTGRVAGQPVEPASAAPPPRQASAPREADVEVIQDAIKRLLEEVNAAEQNEARAQSAGASAPPPLPATAIGGVDRSIDALRMTAGSMRSAMGDRNAGPPAMPPMHAPQGAAPQPPPLPPFVRGALQQPRPASAADARARLMSDAISAGRIDVSLEPILGLEDQQTRHYEVTVRLRDSDGNPLELTPDGPDLRGTGLLPLFDGVRITRTAAVARRLVERGKGGSVFSAFSGESVADEHFLGELAETLHQRASLASQLVLSFTQSDVRGFSTPEWDSLADMRALGFRFAISHITDLDMDFEALAEQGFAFVKLEASIFLDGLPAPSGHLPSSDVCRHLAQHGLTLVVDRIESDDQLARVFGFGVLLGQGQLFGGARPVRADVVGSGRSRTAAA